MAKSNTENSKALRSRRAKEGLKEMRGIWVHKSLEKELKLKIKQLLREIK